MNKVGDAGKRFNKLVKILSVLRGPEGCPWDKVQNERTIRGFFLEEVFEAVEAIEAGNADNLAEELGDVLMEIVFLSRIYEEKGRFTIADALDKINKKMILRHPHVFDKKKMMTEGQVAGAWQKRKLAEKDRASLLEDVGAATPALLSAFLIGRRVSAYGFDWPSALLALKKVKEETAELEEALRKGRRREIGEEVGDLLFALANVSRKLGFNPEIVLRQANRKFVERFRALERELESSGKKIEEADLREMDRIWEKIKKRARKQSAARIKAS